MADATAVSLRRGTSDEHKLFRGNEGEVTVDTTDSTVWVHLGNGEPGTPLATANLSNIDTSNASTTFNLVTGKTTLVLTDYAKNDMSNVTQQTIANLGIAKSDMSNVNTASLATDLGHSGKNLGYSDGSNISTVGLAERTSEGIISEFGKNLAYSDLTNVPTSTIVNKLDDANAYAKADMSNITTAALAESSAQYPHFGDNLAYANLSNVETLTSDTKTHLNNVGIQTTNNLTPGLTYESESQYPSTKAVADALALLNTLPNLPRYNDDPTISLAGCFPYQYILTLNDAGVGYNQYQTLTVYDFENNAAFSLQINNVDEEENNEIVDFNLITNYGSMEYTGTAVHLDTSKSEITIGADLSNLQVNGYFLHSKELDENTPYEFIFDGTNWTLNSTEVILSEYGISVEGIPVQDDKLTIEYFTNATFDVNSVSAHSAKAKWVKNTPIVQDISINDEDGSVAISLSAIPSDIVIKNLIGGEIIEGTWTSMGLHMSFIPTDPDSTLANAWVIKVN